MYFPMVLFIMLHKLVLFFVSVDGATIQMKATVVLFVMLYKLILTSDFGDEIFKCDHSTEGC